VVTNPFGLFNSADVTLRAVQQLPFTRIAIFLGSALVPSSVTVWPFTCTLPDVITFALRRQRFRQRQLQAFHE
jgi:hypothetical protein